MTKKTVPAYYDLIPDVLRLLKKSKDHTLHLSEMHNHFAQKYELGSNLQNGQPTLHNRIGWALTYSRVGGLVENSKRATWKLTKKALNTDLTSDVEIMKIWKKAQQKTMGEYLENKRLKIKKGEVVAKKNSSIPDVSFARLQNVYELRSTRDLDAEASCSAYENILIKAGVIKKIDAAFVGGQ